jgi:hypothetical protein
LKNKRVHSFIKACNICLFALEILRKKEKHRKKGRKKGRDSHAKIPP